VTPNRGDYPPRRRLFVIALIALWDLMLLMGIDQGHHVNYSKDTFFAYVLVDQLVVAGIKELDQ
jgi:hypothetical protein